MKERVDNVVIGAGASGLLLARMLEASGQDFVVFEKSKGLGGRMATRRWEESRFDHGAQFIKVRTLRDHALHDVTLSHGLVSWNDPGVPQGAFVHREGMSAFAKNLARPLMGKIHLHQKVERIETTEQSFMLHTEGPTGNGLTQAGRIFLTAPLPQSLMILQASGLAFPESLSKIQYAKAIVALIRADNALDSSTVFSYREGISGEIHSITNHQRKGISTDTGFSVVMTPTASERSFEQTDQDIARVIQENLQTLKGDLPHSLLSFASRPELYQIKKWRYSHPLQTLEQDFIEVSPNIYLCGDAFRKGSVVGALDSAWSLGQKLGLQSPF